jgi:hypothetical protein
MANARTAREGSAGLDGRPTALTTELADILRQLKSLLDPYRPELHYMRGPGPKWHAKHRPTTVDTHPAPGLFHAEA